MKKLRLLVTEECVRNCAGCCNHGFNLDKLPVMPDDLSEYDEIMITGGEPLLFPEKTFALLELLRDKTKAKIYLYTSFGSLFDYINELVEFDGVHVTIHDNWNAAEIESFNHFQFWVRNKNLAHGSLRLHIFPQVDKSINIVPSLWSRITFTDWIEDCPLPEGEDFMRLKYLWTL